MTAKKVAKMPSLIWLISNEPHRRSPTGSKIRQKFAKSPAKKNQSSVIPIS